MNLENLKDSLKSAKYNMKRYTSESPVWYYWKGRIEGLEQGIKVLGKND